MADVGIEVFDQGPLLLHRQGLGPLQQLALEQSGRIPHLGVGKPRKAKVGTGHKGQEPLEVVARLLGMEVHVGEIRVRRGIEGPALLVVTAQSIGRGQGFNQTSPQAQALLTRADPQQAEGPLGAVNFPAAAIGIQEEVQHSTGLQQGGQGLQACLGLPEVVEHPNGIDVVEGGFPAQVEQAALLKAQRAGLASGPRAAGALAGHLKGSSADIHGEDLGTWIEVGQVIGADPRAAARIQDPPGPGAFRRPGEEGAGHKGAGTIDTPAPVVSRRCAVLKGIAGVGEAVVKGTHHRGGGIGVSGHGISNGQGACFGEHFMGSPLDQHPNPSSCKHLFMPPQRPRPPAVTWPSPVRSRQ